MQGAHENDSGEQGEGVRFTDFPPSFRLAQRGMVAAIVVVLTSTKLAFNQWPLMGKAILIALVVSVVAFALSSACYVVVRYPYLSLIKANDGDQFDRHFTSGNTWLFRLLKGLTLLTLPFVVLGLLVSGQFSVLAISVAIHLALLFFFVGFLTFVYRPESYPTIATFIRATLGLGVVLYPLFIPFIVIGSVRYKRLLNMSKQSDAGTP